MRLPNLAPGRRGAASVIALLVATLGLTAALAYHAYDSARSHEAVAEGVLHDYTEFASWEFGRLAAKDLDASAMAVLNGVRCATGDASVLPPVGVLTAAIARERGCQRPPMTARVFFKALPRDVRADHQTHPQTGRLDVVGEPLPGEVGALVERAIRSGTGQVGTPLVAVHFLERTPRPTVAAYSLVPTPGHAEPTLVGFVADADEFAPVFDRIVQRVPVLPPTLLKRASDQPYLNIRVSGPAGQTVYQSPRFAPSPYSSASNLPAPFDEFRYEVGLRPAVVGTLIIGGLPASRLPLLLALLVLDAGLLAAAIVLVRRERQLDALRADFVTNVSHELRTPLAQIHMFAETLLLGRTRSADETRRSLGIIHRETQRLAHLLDNVMTLRRGERGGGALVPTPVALVPLAREVLETFSVLARQKHIALQLDTPVEISVMADASALRQILLNLLDNAAKYGPPDQTIRLSVMVEGRCARFVVDDEGPGIDERDVARIWEPFVRLPRGAGGAGVTGTGIGLSVVRQLTTLHGGCALVTRSPSGGARFIVELPETAYLHESSLSHIA